MSGSKLLRLCSLFLCLLLCLANFSVTANATDVKNISNEIDFRYFNLDEHPSYSKKFYGTHVFWKLNEIPYVYEYDYTPQFQNFPDGNFLHYQIFDFIYCPSGSEADVYKYYGDKIVVNKGENFKISVSVVESYMIIKEVATGSILNRIPIHQDESFKIYFDLYDISGNFKSVPCEDLEIDLKIKSDDGLSGSYAYYNISASCSNVPFDVYGVRLITVSNAVDSFESIGSDFNAYKQYVLNNEWDILRHIGVDNFTFVIDDSNKNVLNSIVDWLSNIKENLTNGFSNLTSGISNLGSTFSNFITSLGDRISGFFTNLSNNIQSYFTNLGNNIKGFFTSLGDRISSFFIGLVEDIKGLFIPPEGFFEEWKVTFDLMLSDNLGFIYQAPNFVIDIVEVVQEILQSDQEVNLVFPAVEFDIAGYHIELFKDTKVDFSFLEAGIWFTLYSMYKVMLYVIFALALIKYGMSTWERTMAN